MQLSIFRCVSMGKTFFSLIIVLKKCKCDFKSAAGIFEHLSRLDMSPFIYSTATLTPDIQEDTLTALSALMLAQAQEMFLTKAIKDGMKDAIVAKLCAQAEDMYADVQKKMNKDNVKNIWDRSWLTNV